MMRSKEDGRNLSGGRKEIKYVLFFSSLEFLINANKRGGHSIVMKKISNSKGQLDERGEYLETRSEMRQLCLILKSDRILFNLI